MAKKRRMIKKSSLKTFSFFLVFSTVVWFLVQFSKTYTQLIEIPVKYVNVPLDKSISEDRPQSISLQLQETGFSIYYYKIFNPELTVDLSKADVKNMNLVYPIQDHVTDIEEQLQVDLDDSRIIQDEVVVPFQFKKEKTILIKPHIDISYAAGYNADEPVKVTPDSVKISGPENMVDTISVIQTLELDLTKVNKDLSGTVKLDTAGYGKISFYENSVKYSQKVEKFTEGNAEIPVEVINIPNGLNLAYFPKTVVVYYQVNLKNFDKINTADFRVVCDYSEVNEGDDFMVAKIVEKPDKITNIRLNERQIQFVIKR